MNTTEYLCLKRGQKVKKYQNLGAPEEPYFIDFVPGSHYGSLVDKQTYITVLHHLKAMVEQHIDVEFTPKSFHVDLEQSAIKAIGSGFSGHFNCFLQHSFIKRLA